MGLQTFVDDDAGYERWRSGHEDDGFVINANDPPRADYLRLHRAYCHHISQLQRGSTTFTGGDYVKICADGSDARGELERYVARHGWELTAGCYCVNT